MKGRQVKSRATGIRRRNWALWALMFLLVLALTAAVSLLYLPLLDLISRGTGNEAAPPPGFSVVALTGMALLIVLFCVSVAFKQIQLESMRETLVQEAQETESMRHRLMELSALFQLSTTLNLQLRLEVVLEIIVRRVVSSLSAQQASIMLYDPVTGELETRAAYGLDAELTLNARVRMGENIAGVVAERGESVLINGRQDDSEFRTHFKVDRNITSAISLPLRVGERCVGVLNVNRINHPETFEQHHREILSMFAEHVAAIVERAEVLDRLGSRSRELEEANARLTQLNAMKDVFLSTASHELKTPLTSVIAYAELLDDSDNRLSTDQRDEFLHRLRGEAGRLMSLIEDILDLTRLESGKLVLKPGPVPPNDVAQAALETARSVAGKHQVSMREELEDDLPELMLDEVKMRQVVTNLLSNAIKFSPSRGTVVLRTAREPRYVRFDVVDEGPGVAPEEAASIFELFGQGLASREKPGAGVGIGLHLVKRIAEMHGGHVGVHGGAGKGSTFWVRIPITPAKSLQPEGVSQAA